MRLSHLHVQNFRSLLDFEMPLAKLTCLVGANGAGKSTVLQFLDFLAQLVRGDMRGWLEERGWSPADLLSWRDEKRLIAFRACVADTAGRHIGCWEGRFDARTLRCDWEKLTFGSVTFEVREAEFTTTGWGDQREEEERIPIVFEYEGSILAKIKNDYLPAPIAQFREVFRTSRTLELLSPRLMRQRTRGPADSIGRDGKKLSAYIHSLSAEQRAAIVTRLGEVYPELRALAPRAARSGVKILEAEQQFAGRAFRSEARHLNDGLLRLLAIVTTLQSGAALLLFDEIENGVNIEVVQFLVDALTASPSQVVATTHHPVILNFLSDDAARAGMVYVYKTPAGETRARRFFGIPSVAKKLPFMGPGEVLLDTRLGELNAELLAEGAGVLPAER